MKKTMKKTIENKVMEFLTVKNGNEIYNLTEQDYKFILFRNYFLGYRFEPADGINLLKWLATYGFTETKLYKKANKRCLIDLYHNQLLYN